MAKQAGAENPEEGKIPNQLTQEQYLTAVREQTAFIQERKALNEKINARRKVFQSWGVELGIMDAKMKLANRDRDEVREHYDLDRQYAIWLNLPVGTQPDMFAGKEDDDISRRNWYDAGITARLVGKARVAPDDCPEQYLLAWDAGYDDKPITSAGAGGPGSGAGKKKGKSPAGKKALKGEPKKGAKSRGAIATPPVSDKGGLKVVGGKDTSAGDLGDGIGGPGTPGHKPDEPVVH